MLVVGPLEIESKGVDVALRGLQAFRRDGGRFRLRRISYFPPGEAERGYGLADEYHTVWRRSECLSRIALPMSSSAPRGGRKGSGCLPSRLSRAESPPFFRTSPGSARSAPMPPRYFRDGDSESLAAALPQLLTEEARARARIAGPAAAARYDTARVAERLEAAFREALDEAA